MWTFYNKSLLSFKSQAVRNWSQSNIRRMIDYNWLINFLQLVESPLYELIIGAVILKRTIIHKYLWFFVILMITKKVHMQQLYSYKNSSSYKSYENKLRALRFSLELIHDWFFKTYCVSGLILSSTIGMISSIVHARRILHLQYDKFFKYIAWLQKFFGSFCLIPI